MFVLCKLLNFTEYELACLCAIPWRNWKEWREADRFPSYVALHFTELMSWFWWILTGVEQQPVRPIHLLVK